MLATFAIPTTLTAFLSLQGKETSSPCTDYIFVKFTSAITAISTNLPGGTTSTSFDSRLPGHRVLLLQGHHHLLELRQPTRGAQLEGRGHSRLDHHHRRSTIFLSDTIDCSSDVIDNARTGHRVRLRLLDLILLDGGVSSCTTFRHGGTSDQAHPPHPQR